ncbi:hypothetical protein KS4_37060 [Poriferisphaera corsica]|uniref:Uncharacterized protein n=1 Tax=Poriferisphaera corsica TaxID=2528020 RepID=A0A517YZN1_9BACT|nr:hypothetical protein [Poriferisphaera corsica]QDU35623.1 hypothetical protein KS4_37060 [Poriferisphaera corsica]
MRLEQRQEGLRKIALYVVVSMVLAICLTIAVASVYTHIAIPKRKVTIRPVREPHPVVQLPEPVERPGKLSYSLLYELNKVQGLEIPRDCRSGGFSRSGPYVHMHVTVSLYFESSVLDEWLATAPLLQNRTWITDREKVQAGKWLELFEKMTKFRYLKFSEETLPNFEILIDETNEPSDKQDIHVLMRFEYMKHK